jgi:DNA-binding transcriptional LysR family regulator
MGVAPLAGTVRISAPPVMASHLLVPRLAPLRRSLPGVTLELVGETREANLTRREADIALRLSRPTAEGLAARSLVEVGYGLYGARSYVAEVDSQNWEFVGYEESLLGTPQQQWLEKTAGSRTFAFRSNDLGCLLQAVKAGLGVGALPHFLAAADPALTLLSPDCPVTRTLWLVMHPDVRRSPRVRAVADAIAGLLSED